MSALDIGWQIEDEIIAIPLQQHGQEQYEKLTDEQFFDYFNELFDPDFEKYIGWEKPETVDELKHLLNEMRRNESVIKTHRYYFIKDTNKLIGLIYLYGLEPKYKKAKLGISINQKFRRQNFAEKAIRSMINQFMDQTFDQPVLTRLVANVELENKPSQALMNNLGFINEGLLKNYYGLGDDVLCYAHVLSKNKKGQENE